MYGIRSLYDEKTIQDKKIMACSEELRRLTSDKRKIRRMSQEEYVAYEH